MIEADAPLADATNAEISARPSDSQAIPEVPISRAAAGLSRQITAIQRAIEGLDTKMTNALRRDEQIEFQVLQAQREGLKARRAMLQGFLDREME